uniref:Protein RMD5 homolog A n=1 Tax=Cacopsylla melanoneura TaxID=428564 RepID=A0A8D8RNM4_9HEMI
MDACMNVEKEVDKVLSKFSSIRDHAQRTVDDTAQYISNLKTELDQCPPEHELTASQVHILKDALQKVKDTVQRLATDHRDLHSTVSKVGKAIDRNFVSDFAVISKDDVFSGAASEDLLNQVICKHFYRQGLLDIADELTKEAGLEPDTSSKEPFTDLNKILDSLKQRDLSPALQWARIHREELLAQNSSLDFRLHQLKFISLLQKGMAVQSDAIAYARMFLGQFVNRHEKEIQTMMGMMMYLPHGIACSPYAHMLESALWGEISDVFIRDACSLLGLSLDSPLTVSVNAGCVALPALLNIKQVMQQRVSGLWNGHDELPIEIDLGSNHRYHSVFACPILKTQSTESNPPMRLVCGHVISREALNKLGTATKLKCPYCPVEQSPGDARQISTCCMFPCFRLKCPYCPVEQSPGDARQIHF